MLGNLWVSASGMQTDSWRITALANDIANVNTPGFQALLPGTTNTAPLAVYAAGLAGGAPAVGAVLAGGGTTPAGLRLDLTPGGVRPTGRPLDVAVQGAGFFALRTAAGQTVYTRAGRFFVDGAGGVVDGAGRALLDAQGRAIRLPPGAAGPEVSAAGEVTALVGGKRQGIAQIGLVLPTNAQGLVGVGVGTLAATPAAGPLHTFTPGRGPAGALQSGVLEGSNASLATLLPSLLSAQRAYQINARAFAVGLQMEQLTNQL